MPEVVLTPARLVPEPDVVPPRPAVEVMGNVLVPRPRSPERVGPGPSPAPTRDQAPSPVVELGFADGRRAQMPPTSPQTAALLAVATRLLERRA